jgi:hypothetical protein
VFLGGVYQSNEIFVLVGAKRFEKLLFGVVDERVAVGLVGVESLEKLNLVDEASQGVDDALFAGWGHGFSVAVGV